MWFFFFKQKTEYVMRISEWSSDVGSSDLHFPRLEAVYWREGSPDFASVAALIGSLDTRPDHSRLRAAAQALDLTLLKRLADEAWVRDREIGRASCRERVCQYV